MDLFYSISSKYDSRDIRCSCDTSSGQSAFSLYYHGQQFKYVMDDDELFDTCISISGDDELEKHILTKLCYDPNVDFETVYNILIAKYPNGFIL